MVFFILAVIIQQIDYFLMPDNLCCSEHPKTIHQGKNKNVTAHAWREKET